MIRLVWMDVGILVAVSAVTTLQVGRVLGEARVQSRRIVETGVVGGLSLVGGLVGGVFGD